MKRWLGRGRWWIVVLLSSLCVAQAYNAYRTITMSAPASDITIPENTVIQYHQLSWTKTGTVSTCTVALDSSTDGTTWSAGGIITGQTCTSNGNSAITAGSANYIRITATALSGGGSVQFIYKGWVANPSGSVALPVSVANGGTGSATGFTSAGVIALFTGCSGTQYLGADGACHTSSSAVASVFGRIGAVVAASADYSVAQVTGAAPLASPTFTGTPAAPTPAASDNSTTIPTTAYVTTAIANAVAGVNPAVAVRVATTGVLPNSPTYNNGVGGIGATLTTATTNTALVVDGVTLGLNDRVLVKNQASSFQNGVYFLSQLQGVALAWILTRALDFDTPSDMNNTGAIPVISGTVNTTTQWVISSAVTTVGTDAVTFAQFSSNPANLVTAVSPGAGIAHFAGSTQAVTSSPIVAADITSGTITTTQLAAAATPAMVQLETHTASGSTTVDFTNAALVGSTYHVFKFVFTNVLPASAGVLQLLVGTGGGPTYSNTGYSYGGNLFNSGGTGAFGLTNQTTMQLSGNGVLATAALGGVSGELILYTPQAGATVNVNVTGGFGYFASGTNPTYSVVVGSWTASAAVTAVRFQFPSINTTSGTITMYGITP